jgi:hypothetical protein
MKTYQEKLRDPRWQKKRLEILNRDNWRCVCCGDTEQTLNVHHIQYDCDIENPWDYENGFLATVCEDCHASVRENRFYIPWMNFPQAVSWDFITDSRIEDHIGRVEDSWGDFQNLHGNWGPLV